MSANDFEIDYWNGAAGERWARAQERIDEMVQPLVRPLLDGGSVRPGMRVLDVGCGSGGSTLELAELVGPAGLVTGIDVSRPMLARARERARDGGFENVRFHEGDAQLAELPASELAFSRFGVMFFADPVAGFSNIRGALVPGSPLLAAVWADGQHNPWMIDPPAVVADILDIPERRPDGKGPFSLSDPLEIVQVLEAAGFSHPEVEAVEGPLRVGLDPDDATNFSLYGVGPVSAGARDAPPPALERARAELREHYRRLATESGVFADAAVLHVRARA